MGDMDGTSFVPENLRRADPVPDPSLREAARNAVEAHEIDAGLPTMTEALAALAHTVTARGDS